MRKLGLLVWPLAALIGALLISLSQPASRTTLFAHETTSGQLPS